MKVVLQLLYGPDYVDSVKGCLLLAVTTAPETRSNLKQILSLFPLLDLTDQRHVFTSDLKVLCMISGLLEGAARYPCSRCTYNWTTEQECIPRIWSQHLEMAEKLKSKYGADPKHVKDCYGVALHPLVQFDYPNRAFPIAQHNLDFEKNWLTELHLAQYSTEHRSN